MYKRNLSPPLQLSCRKNNKANVMLKCSLSRRQQRGRDCAKMVLCKCCCRGADIMTTWGASVTSSSHFSTRAKNRCCNAKLWFQRQYSTGHVLEPETLHLNSSLWLFGVTLLLHVSVFSIENGAQNSAVSKSMKTASWLLWWPA